MWPSNNLHFLISTIPCLLFGVLGLMAEYSQLGLQEYSLHPTNFPLKLLITELMFYMKRESELQFQLLGRNFPERRGQIFFRLLFYQMLK